jgi:hypothetical protein
MQRILLTRLLPVLALSIPAAADRLVVGIACGSRRDSVAVSLP